MPITINGTTDARIGLVDTSMSAFTADLDGTHVAPGDVVGSMNPVLGSFVSALEGQFGSSTSVDGQFRVRPDDFTSQLIGNQIQTIDGDLNVSLGAFASRFTDAARAFDYRKWGIPYPTDPVPSAIMPTLPTGADYTNHEWIGTYDPCTIANPTHADIAPNWPSAEQANCYYVDQFDGAATDTANPYGYPDKPRVSIPSAAFGASSLYLEIHGNNSAWVEGAPQYSIDPTITMAGTSTTPKFVVGVDGPWLARDWDITGQHLIFDGLKMQERASGNQFARFTVQGGGKYICFRNGVLRGSGASDGGQCFGMDGTDADNLVEFVVLYNSEIHDIGSSPTGTADAHCWRPTYWCRYLWCLDNTIHNAEGDGVQVGNSNNSRAVAASAHYVYIAGNDFYTFRENTIDCKNSYHVICAKNTLHDCDFNDGSNDTGVIMSNNSEGPNTAYHWYIANEIYDCSPALRFSGNQTGERTFAICNWVHDCDTGIAFAEYGGLNTVDEYIVHNTITNCAGGMLLEGFGAPAEIEVVGNISYDCGATHIEAPTNNGSTVSTLEDQLTYNSDTSNAEDNAASFDTAAGNQESTDPEFTDPANDDFTLKATSPALGVVATRHSVFTEFNDLYGIDIAYDYVGNPIPATNADAGAWQKP